MKIRRLNIFNTAVATVLNTVANVVNDLRLDGDAAEQWQMLVPYGEYPATTVINGQVATITQVLDRAAGELMQENFSTVLNTVRHLGRGLPIYIEHPDNSEWRAKNPGADPSSKGRIKKLEAREDGVWMQTVFNSDGRELIGGDAPKYSAQSPNWDMVPVDAGKTRWRPYVLRSIGLTNKPNIGQCAIGLNTAGAFESSPTEAASAVAGPENTENETMTPEALKALGFAPDATPSPQEISAAVVKMLGEKTTADAAKQTAETNLTAANTRADGLKTELDGLRSTMVTTAINTAITEGRITAADKPTWEGLLKVDLVNGVAALGRMGKATALNTENQLGDLGGRREEGVAAPGTITAINTAVEGYAKEHGLDLKKDADHKKAFAAVEAAKPELFKPAAKA